MNDAFLVGRFQSVRDLARVVQRGLQRDRPLERCAIDQFHHQRAILYAINGRDVGMVQCGKHLGLALEAGHAFRVTGERIRQHLQRDFTLQLGVFGAINLAHAPRADRREDLVGAKTSPTGYRHCVSNDSNLPVKCSLPASGDHGRRNAYIAFDGELSQREFPPMK